MLKGLEISILRLSEVREENSKVRLDSGYFTKAALNAETVVKAMDNSCLGDLAETFRKGIFDIKADSYVDAGQGVPFIRISDFKTGVIQKHTTAWISHAAHSAEVKTGLKFGDIILSKTAYPAAAMVNLRECNVSQDTIAMRLSVDAKKHYRSGYVAAFLNSEHGRTLLSRRFQGNVQQHLSLEDGKRIRIPRLSLQFQELVHGLVTNVDRHLSSVVEAMDAAQDIYLSAIGLQEWQPPEPLAYTARATDVLAAGRFDARFFAPRVRALLKLLSTDGRLLSDVARPRREKFRAQNCSHFRYIEISDIDEGGGATSSLLTSAEAPSRATWYVRAGDIVSSTVRPIRRLTSQILQELDGSVCSSGFVVLTPTEVPAEVLLTYLRLPAICELLDLYASASMYPTITDSEIFNLPFPKISESESSEIQKKVLVARAARAPPRQNTCRPHRTWLFLTSWS